MSVGDDETDPRLAFGQTRRSQLHARRAAVAFAKDVRVSLLECPVIAAVELKKYGGGQPRSPISSAVMEISSSAIALTFASSVARNWSMPTAL